MMGDTTPLLLKATPHRFEVFLIVFVNLPALHEEADHLDHLHHGINSLFVGLTPAHHFRYHLQEIHWVLVQVEGIVVME